MSNMFNMPNNGSTIHGYRVSCTHWFVRKKSEISEQTPSFVKKMIHMIHILFKMARSVWQKWLLMKKRCEFIGFCAFDIFYIIISGVIVSLIFWHSWRWYTNKNQTLLDKNTDLICMFLIFAHTEKVFPCLVVCWDVFVCLFLFKCFY